MAENENIAAMREALEAFQRWYEERKSNVYHSVKLATAVDKMYAALSVPPRNCDVGTPEEQMKRFLLVCRDKRHFDNVRECPLFVGTNCNSLGCFARWSQMPYEAG